jgi:pyruvate formate lyase activating enzyme
MTPMREALYGETAEGGRVHCLLCPNDCRIADGKTGTCGVRENRSGRLTLPFYGAISSLGVDPIEKKPLYHFHPGSTILSAGFVGCSFRCGFCQNWHISQSTDAGTRQVGPEELVKLAVRERSFGIAYTYSEPLVHFEYVLDTSKLARAAGLKNVLVTNGYLNAPPADELFPFVDAANVDLKAWDPEFYRRETGGKLEEVKRFIRDAAGRIHLEVTTLIIPTKNDDPAQIEGIAGFIAGLDPDIPLHLSAYHPQHAYTIPPTPPGTVRRLAEVARRHLRYVYIGNLGVEVADTTCDSCGNVLVRRVGWHVEVTGIQGGKCSKCGAGVPIVGA